MAFDIGASSVTPLLFARDFRAESLRMVAERARAALGRPNVDQSDFDERRYLFLHPEVEQAIEAGALESAYDHWVCYGVNEGREGGPLPKAPRQSDFVGELSERAFGLNVFGTLSTPSGIGGVARGIAAAARNSGLQSHAIDIMAATSAAPIDSYRVNLLVHWLSGFESLLAAHGPQLFAGAYNIGFWFWELPAAHPYWCRFFRYFDEMWVASEFCRHAFQCLTNLPVVRIPPLIDRLEAHATFGREHFGFSPDVFVFTSIFDVGSYVERKNPMCLIRAFRREFGDSPKVELYLKIWNSQRDPEGMRAIERGVQGAANIRIYDGVFSNEEMASLHSQGDCLVSPHRSEGFGLNMAEAMYFGKPAIATGYSANVDFMNETNSYLIDHRLVPLAQDYGPYPKGSVWAEPSEDHLCQLMRRVLTDADERVRKGEAARQTILRGYSLAAVERAMSSRFQEAGIDQPDVTKLRFCSHPERPPLFPESMDDAAFRKVLKSEMRTPVSLILAVGRCDAVALRATIESVRGQWYPLWELCVVEDGTGSDESLQVLESYRGVDERIKILCGFSAAFEKAVEISRHELLWSLQVGQILASEAVFDAVRTAPGKLMTKADYYCNPTRPSPAPTPQT